MRSFLNQVLGGDKSSALANALARRPELQSLIGPRVALSWVKQNVEFDGKLPGTDSHIRLSKSATGYNGFCKFGLNKVFFDNSTPEYVAATITYSMGCDLSKTEVDSQSYYKFCVVVDRWLEQNLSKKVLDPSLGYKLSHTITLFKDGKLVHVDVHDSSGAHVGNAKFWHNGHSLTPASVVVDEDHQRKGIASAMYSHAEKTAGASIVPSSNQTEEGAKLWEANLKNKQFGKAELGAEAAGGAASPKKPQEPQAANAPMRGVKPRLPKLPKQRGVPAALPNPLNLPKPSNPDKLDKI